MSLGRYRGVGVLIRDANNKRRGPSPDQILCESGDSDDEIQPEYRWNITDPATLRIRPGDKLRLSYTLTVEERIQADYLNPTHADTHYLNSGEMYKLTDTQHFYHWIFEDALPNPVVSQKGLAKILSSQPRTQTVAAKSIEFCAVGTHPEKRGTRRYGIVGYEFISG